MPRSLATVSATKPAPTPRKPCRRCGHLNCTCIEDELARQILLAGLPTPVREYPFAKTTNGRQWRADFGWPFIRLLVECEGGIWSGGAHVQGTGYSEDLEKYNEAELLEFMVLRFTRAQVADGTALRIIERGMRRRGVKKIDGKLEYTVRFPAL